MKDPLAPHRSHARGGPLQGGHPPGTARPRAGLAAGMELTVIDAPDRDRYEIRDGDRLLGLAAYRRRGTQVVFTHTEVDEDAEHSGLGSRLVRGALDDVRSQGGTVVPECPFVAGWIERHPEYRDLLEPERTA